MKLRVLIADDSAFMRSAVSRLLSADDRFEIVGQAKDGAEAVDLARSLKPDVMTMDFNMPGLDGAQATRKILGERPVGIVMLSAHTKQGAEETMAALAAGAFDFVQKPGGHEVSTQLHIIRDELSQKLVAAARAKISAGAPAAARATEASTPDEPPTSSARRPPRALAALPRGLKVCVIASSTGGPAALERLVPNLPRSEALAVVIVQHLPIGYTDALARRLNEASPMEVREATASDRVAAGIALVAPGGKHLEIDRAGGVRLTDDPPVHGVKPAADVTLKSLAAAFGARAIGVVLTGMGRDGALGLAAIKSAGGLTFAQDAATSVVYGMPKVAVELGVVDQVLPLTDIAAAIARVATT